MANLQQAVPENVGGEFFVDRTCIDCGTCRQIAPETFAEADDYSYVHHQPDSQQATHLALQALVCCPTGSIGTISANRAKLVMADFPLRIEENIFYNGFTSPKSYGASSYFIQHPDGNWLVDSPKFLPQLVRRFEELGGMRYLFLTHSDDVGEAERYAKHFGATRIIHQQEAWSQPEAELIVEGFEVHPVTTDFTVIPTPGHTQGSCCLLYKNWALFSGDHLWWEPETKRLAMPTHYYWNQQKQVDSSRDLLRYQFEWVLPGHGHRVKLSEEQMKTSLEDMIQHHQAILSR